MLQTSAERQAGSRSLQNWSLKCNLCQVIYITNALLCEFALHSLPLERFVIQRAQKQWFGFLLSLNERKNAFRLGLFQK